MFWKMKTHACANRVAANLAGWKYAIDRTLLVQQVTGFMWFQLSPPLSLPDKNAYKIILAALRRRVRKNRKKYKRNATG